ncbi:MAG: alpha/beta fold hydrolase [Planctomycetes bacterium]|jgi:dienelactone hydrolase|nr:alpha/beta fold hydrolase [Planctomycetota bacterium]
MKLAWTAAVAIAAAGIPAFLGASATAQEKAQTLLEARQGFKTSLARVERADDALEEPPAGFFSIVKYRTPIGEMSAYLGKPPSPGKKHPAIVWITGGFPAGGIDSDAWEPVDIENDQSAKAYRLAGVVMMYPTLRGTCGNPGSQECFFGEVDDVLAALEHLKGVEYVDPKRIYLGGHSTGGVLALLVAEATDGFRAVFSFGPIADMTGADPDDLTYDLANERENRLRSPVHFLGAVRSPTFVIEGTRGSIESLRQLESASTNPALRFLVVKGANHFDVLAPLNRLIASKIAAQEGDAKIELSSSVAQAEYAVFQAAAREAADLDTLAALRRELVDFAAPRVVSHYLWSTNRAALEKAAARGAEGKFESGSIAARRGDDGVVYDVLALNKQIALDDVNAVFAASKFARQIADDLDIDYEGWGLKK